MAAKTFPSREEALAAYNVQLVKSIKPGDVIDIVDLKNCGWMRHPVIIKSIRNGYIFGFECTSSREPSTYKGWLEILDWEAEGFDAFCEYHTVKCDRVEAYDMRNVIARRGKATRRDLDRIEKEHARYLRYEGQGQTEAQASTMVETRKREFNLLRSKAKPVLPMK